MTRNLESPYTAIRVLRNMIACMQAEGVSTVALADLERAVDKKELALDAAREQLVEEIRRVS